MKKEYIIKNKDIKIGLDKLSLAFTYFLFEKIKKI